MHALSSLLGVSTAGNVQDEAIYIPHPNVQVIYAGADRDLKYELSDKSMLRPGAPPAGTMRSLWCLIAIL